MFTGIIENHGELTHIEPKGKQRVYTITAKGYFKHATIGDSVAVDGVCLTVVEKTDNTANFDVAEETLRRSTLSKKDIGDMMNLEMPLAVGDKLGGHMVQGHVDGMAEVQFIKQEPGGDMTVTFKPVDEHMLRYIVEKGSVAINGVSLTITQKTETTFSVMLIDHTMKVTNLGKLRANDYVNVEFDVMAKYFESMMNGYLDTRE